MPRLVSVEILVHFGVTAAGACAAGTAALRGTAACAAPGNSPPAVARAVSAMRQERVTGLRMGVSSLTWPESCRTGRELSMLC